jgi:glycolate oxidase FAD binding subunit
MIVQPNTIDELQRVVLDSEKLLPCGRRTKPLLSEVPSGFDTLDMTRISGILSYDPGEFTFTALAGTQVADVKQQLNLNGQYLPFDPILVKKGATLGGTVASGINGPSRYRYGGMRDFLLSARFVNSQGEIIKGGEKVVKNSAGFDFHKLMIGSLGRLGILVDLTFKVFPRPEKIATVCKSFTRLEDALEIFWKFSNAQLDLDSLDLEIKPGSTLVWARIGAPAVALSKRVNLLTDFLGGGDVLEGPEEEVVWDQVRELNWVPENWSFVKVPLTPGRIPGFEQALSLIPAGKEAIRRYGSGGQQAWLAFPGAANVLNDMLLAQGLSGLVVLGISGPANLGISKGDGLIQRVKTAVDPAHRFAEV